MTEPTAGAAQPATPRTEPGIDLPGPTGEELRDVADSVDGVPGAHVDTAAAHTAGSDAEPASDGSTGAGAVDPAVDGVPGPSADPLAEALALAGARLGDLQRERAEFVNYRRRVERDRDVAGTEARDAVLGALLPVLDDIDGARSHGDLTGPFAAVADKLDATLHRLGLEPFGEAGEVFDPALHEALLQDGATAVDVPTCTQVLQRGYRAGDRVLRPARVAVATPAT